MAFLGKSSTLIKDQALVDAAKDVKLYADYVAGKHGQIASDLLLAAVWCCLNPSAVGKRASLYRGGQKASQNAKRSKAKTENARKKEQVNVKDNANTGRKGVAEKEGSQDVDGDQHFFDMDSLEVDAENFGQLSAETCKKPTGNTDSLNDTNEQNKQEKRQLAINTDTSQLEGDSLEDYVIEDKTDATAEVIDLDSDTEATISKPRPVSDTDENSEAADLPETVGNESATDLEQGGDMSKNSFSDFEQSHDNASSSVYQGSSERETYTSPACIPGLVPVSQAYPSRSRRKSQHTVKYEEAEIDNALYEMQEAEREECEGDEQMGKEQQIITVKEECSYTGIGDESANQGQVFQSGYQDPCSSQQTFCQPLFMCPAPKRRLLDHDKKWNTQPDFSPDQLKYLAVAHEMNKTDEMEDFALKRKIPDNMDFNQSFELEGHDSNLGITHTQSTLLKKHRECGICGKSVDSEFNLCEHLKNQSSADFQDEPLDLTSEHMAILPISHPNLIDMYSDDRELDISYSKKEQKFLCKICGYSSKFKQNLKRHLQVHINLSSAPKSKGLKTDNQSKCRKILRCDACDYTTSFKFNLTRHVKQVHTEKQKDLRPVFTCEFCGKELHSKFAQKLHVKTVHTKIFKYTCPTCKKGFNQLRPYKGHLASHHDIFKEKCDLCSATFRHKSSLVEHKQSVHENTVFQCPHPSCSAVYSSARPLRDHEKAEHSDKRLPCDKCPQTFKWRSSLKYHKNTCHKTE